MSPIGHMFKLLFIDMGPMGPVLLILLAFGTFVIGLADNFLRPILVGQSIQMPSYVVLLATLGGLAAFGANGFVIGPLVAAMFLTTWQIYVGSKVQQEVRK